MERRDHCNTDINLLTTDVSELEMVNLGPARGPKRAGTGRAGPGLKIQASGPLRAETGLIIFFI